MFSTRHRGRVTAKCTDCGKGVDYYVDIYEKKIWKLELVGVRRSVMKEEVRGLVEDVEVTAGKGLPPGFWESS